MESVINSRFVNEFEQPRRKEITPRDLYVRRNPYGGVEMMTTVTEEMREVVYNNLYQLYSRYAFECFPYMTKELTNIISASAYQELIQMIQGGYIKDYYERIKRNAV